MRLTKDQRRAQILQNATRLFVERGYHATKTKDIAKECGVTEPVIYKHFNSKDQLFLEVISSIAGETFHEISFDSNSDREQMLTSFVMNRVSAVENYFPIFKRLLTELLEDEEIRRYYFDKYLPRLANPLIGYLDQLKDQGLIKTENSSKVIALSLAGILIIVSVAKYLESDTAFSDLESHDLAGQLLQMYLHGIMKN